MFRNVTLKCLTEISGIQALQYNAQFTDLFMLGIAKLKQVSSWFTQTPTPSQRIVTGPRRCPRLESMGLFSFSLKMVTGNGYLYAQCL